MIITGTNNGSQQEIMDKALHDLRNDPKNNYLTARVGSGKDALEVHAANKRGFVIALDYQSNGTMGYMSPTISGATGNLVTTHSPSLDRMTCNYQYVQFGHEVDNENVANSRPGMHVGATAKALAKSKEMKRRLEVEEWYFCRGDGSQIIGDITAGVSIAALATGTLTLSGARDGAGAAMLRVGQVIRIYDVTLATLKSVATVTAKTTNGAVSIVPQTALTSGNAVVDTDVVLPQGDTSAPTTTGVKGLPYLSGRTSGNYFDKTLSAVPALQPIVDSSTTTFTRTTMEYLNARHEIRNNGNVNTQICTSVAQRSNYYAQFYAQNTAQVHVVGDGRPGIDVGGKKLGDYTFWGAKINAYRMIHPKYWFNLDFSSFYRLTLKEGEEMLTQASPYLQKIAGGAYTNALQSFSDDYLEYLSPNPAMNSAFTALTFSGLPLWVNDPYTGS